MKVVCVSTSHFKYTTVVLNYIVRLTGVSSTFLTDRYNAKLANFSGQLTQNLKFCTL